MKLPPITPFVSKPPVAPPLEVLLLHTLGEAVIAIRSSIINVKSKGFEMYRGRLSEAFTFNIQKHPGIKHSTCGRYKGWLAGRNKDLCLGHSVDADSAIVARAFLDGDVKKQSICHRIILPPPKL